MEYLSNWKNNESSPTSNFSDDCNELRVDSTELRVVSILCYIDVVEAILSLCWLSINVPEFGVPHSSKPKLNRTLLCNQLQNSWSETSKILYNHILHKYVRCFWLLHARVVEL